MLLVLYRYKKWPPIVLLVPNFTLKLAFKDKEFYDSLLKETPRGLLFDFQINNNHVRCRRL